ncbi:MAG: nucleoside phosphorylase [Bacteroidales bacterium]|nr:nucleoside phosphorylase [Bacteroidales bacterium]
MKIAASELPLQKTGAIYHLNLFPEELADHIILVGDPGRVSIVSQRFDCIEVKKENRELLTHTGTYKGKRISVISTGMGTDNIDIVLNELDALASIDLKTMTVKENRRTLTMVRVGTCGALHPDIPIHSYIAAKQGFGIDGVLQFYRHEGLSNEPLVSAFVEQTDWNERLPYPYCIEADDDLFQQIGYDMIQGITMSAPGFFGPQGRQVRALLQYPDLNSKIEKFSYNGLKITNLEMECSAIYGLSKILNHKALTVCLAIANRANGAFSEGYEEHMGQLIDVVLERL